MAEDKPSSPATKPTAPATPAPGGAAAGGKPAAGAKPAAAPAPPKPAAPAADVSAKPKKGRAAAVKKWAIVVLVSALVAAVCYGVGYFQGASGKDELEQTAEAATLRASLLEARRQLDLASVALDSQNFGIANEHLTASAEALAGMDPEGPVAELADEVTHTRMVASQDVATQKQSLRALIARFDAQIDEPAAGPDAEAP